MKLLSPAISRLARLRLWSIEQWLENPLGAQYGIWQDLLAAGQYTEFGRKHGFSKINSIKEYKQAVPVQEYDDLKPYIFRMMEGEENLLWNTPIRWFAKSSGTTNDKSKFIPVSDESLTDGHFKASKDVLTFYYKNMPDSDLLTGKGLLLGGSHQISKHNEEVQYGDLSAVMLQNMPFWSNWLRTPDLSIALMDEWESKIEKIAQTTIHENVTSIAGVPTWTLVLMKRVLEITGKANILEVWPSLELYMHGGVSFVPYREQFEKIIGGRVNYLEMYNASEGFFAAQSDLGQDGMQLFLEHGVFYEFMPVEEYGQPHPLTFQLDEVETGRNYAPIISTNGGLWRYVLGDTIQFTSIDPFKIKVTGRLRHFINAFGEELMVDNSDAAIAIACERTGAHVMDYTAAPMYFSDHENGGHEWLIEFSQPPENLELFTYELDTALKSVNSDYEAKRHRDIALHMPLVHAVRPNLFSDWLRSKGKLGGQHKVPRLSNDRKYLEDILGFEG